MSFRAKTHEGYIIKVLSELLADNIKIGCFVVSKQGIFFRMTDSHRKLCIDFELLAENFDHYQFQTSSPDQKILMGINLPFLQKILKPVKKNETIEIIKENETSDTLCFKTIPTKETGDKVTTNYIKIQEIQAIDMALCEEYDQYISIPACDYQKMCKDMGSISHDIQIRSTKSSIKFTSDMTGVYSRSILFGDDADEDEIYCQHFESAQLNSLKRISGLSLTKSCNIQVFSKADLPVMLKTNVGALGKIRIYMKSKEQMEAEKSSELAD